MNEDQKIADQKALENNDEPQTEELKPEQLDEIAGGQAGPGHGR